MAGLYYVPASHTAVVTDGPSVLLRRPVGPACSAGACGRCAEANRSTPRTFRAAERAGGAAPRDGQSAGRRGPAPRCRGAARILPGAPMAQRSRVCVADTYSGVKVRARRAFGARAG